MVNRCFNSALPRTLIHIFLAETSVKTIVANTFESIVHVHTYSSVLTRFGIAFVNAYFTEVTGETGQAFARGKTNFISKSSKYFLYIKIPNRSCVKVFVPKFTALIRA